MSDVLLTRGAEEGSVGCFQDSSGMNGSIEANPCLVNGSTAWVAQCIPALLYEVLALHNWSLACRRHPNSVLVAVVLSAAVGELT